MILNSIFKLLAVASVVGASLGMPAVAADNGAKQAVSNKAAAPKPVLGEAEIRKALESVVSAPGAIESIRKAGYGGFYEVALSNGDIVYVDETGSYFFTGSLVDIGLRKDVTQARIAELSRINFADLPLNQAIKQVKGNGKRVIATFEDPNCGYCKKLAKEFTNMKDVTIYTFLIPILAADSNEKVRNIWCAPDRAKAWNDWMVDGKLPATANCDTPTGKNSEMARKFRINGTPTIFFADGTRVGGYVPVDQLEKQMLTVAEAQPAGKKK